ncbi:Thiol-disulfide isomerase or thioredoxin [Cyclobacterium lianum]|uniref:Thiol-disulfide isomerase or thioredoxin n=1 Tax=Cyclobacterium lianum TaxID=388280 RepID=A0A1M7QJG0_9BACT|nr:TlpA disulfide reductase family protein [Cyclobacterium lianum]SHN30960.1 Thiol-disulfide isomerase or thioredoxin [Cyclobacterium lianum]
MSKYQIILPILLHLLFPACKEKSEGNSISGKVGVLDPEVTINKIESDFSEWWTYHSANISLSSDFIGLNEKSDTIHKEQFLEQLTSGDFIPLKLKSADKTEIYKLYELDTLADKGIGSIIKNASTTNLKHFRMEGKTFPEFDFTDFNGRHYNNENTKGKTILIKTWFIGCTACIAEFPELNKLAEDHENDDDRVFVSLALDAKPELERFLLKKPFKYQVVPEKRDFLEKELNLQIYPTHIVVDKNGIIVKVVNKASEMIAFIENNMD